MAELVVLEEAYVTETALNVPVAVRTVKVQVPEDPKAEVIAPVEEMEAAEEEVPMAQLPEELLEALELLQDVQNKENEADRAVPDADDAENRRQEAQEAVTKAEEAKAAAESAQNDAKVYEAI